ncbi:MAG: ferrous iron transporter B [Clostridiales bacterium]|nr:ferrous iron transporter B [Clostridiales bacterium]
MISLALVGNPNSGKTSLYNYLTGENQTTGNRTGVTTSKVEGSCKMDKAVKIIDLPGAYSLEGWTKDQIEVSNYFKRNTPTAIINVVDGTNLIRNLYLSLTLLKLKIPMVIAINFLDVLKKRGIEVDAEKLSQKLGVNVVCISVLKQKNLDTLVKTALSASNIHPTPKLSKLTSPPEIYAFLEAVVGECITKRKDKSILTLNKIDEFLCGKVSGFLLFFAIIFVIYYASYYLGGFLGGYVHSFFDMIKINTVIALNKINATSLLISLVTTIFEGVGTVLSFLPQILVLFFILGVLEESGYTSRVAFIFDRLFRSIGLGGKSVIPLVLSCGCTVTGLMTTRTIDDESDRITSLILTPFMPCGAKMAVYGYLAYAVFGGNPFISISLFSLSTLSVFVCGFLLKKFKIFAPKTELFILEIPALKLPAIKNVINLLWEKTKDFIVKAGTVIFSATVLLWFLMNFGISGYTPNDITKSFIYGFGNAIKVVFYPLGFCNYQTSIAILSSFVAKESVVQVLTVLTTDVSGLFVTKFSAYSFLAFITLSPPCVASLAVAKRELGTKNFLFMLVFQTLYAYTVSMLINFIGLIFSGYSCLIFGLIIVILLLIAVILPIKVIFRCKNCGSCDKRWCKLR